MCLEQDVSMMYPLQIWELGQVSRHALVRVPTTNEYKHPLENLQSCNVVHAGATGLSISVQTSHARQLPDPTWLNSGVVLPRIYCARGARAWLLLGKKHFYLLWGSSRFFISIKIVRAWPRAPHACDRTHTQCQNRGARISCAPEP